MNKLLKSTTKNIETDRGVINALPKTGIKQIRDSKKKIESMLDNYKKMKTSVTKEMKKRYENITAVKENPEIETVKKQILELDNLGLSDNVLTSFEKMELDKLLYNMNGYYKKNLATINEEIIKCVKKFKEVGIQITKKDFNINESVAEYMSVLLDESGKGNYNSEKIKNTFDSLYWECSDIIPHIIVNIRNIYDRYESEIDLFYKNKLEKKLKDSKLTKEQLENKKQELIKKLNSLVSVDGRNILDNFLNNTYRINDYKRKNYDKTYETLTSKNVDDMLKEEKNDMDANFAHLYDNIVEYINYLEFKFIIDEVLLLRDEKDQELDKQEESKEDKKENKKDNKKSKKKNKNSKTELEAIKHEIKNLTKDIEKVNSINEDQKSKFGFLKKKEKNSNKIDSAKRLERDNKILSIRELYAKLDRCSLKEAFIENVDDGVKILDVLRFASYDYGFLARSIIKKYPDIVEADIHSMIDRIRKFVRLYDFSVINNINMFDKKDISIVIKDKYKLLGMNLTKENFSEAGLDELIREIQSIKIYNDIVKSNILLEDIQFVISAKAILKK